MSRGMMALTLAGTPYPGSFGSFEPVKSARELPGDPDYDVPDGDVDADDFFRYLDLFAAGDARADLTGSNDPNDPGYGVPDGVIDVRDFFFYLELFSLGCQ